MMYLGSSSLPYAYKYIHVRDLPNIKRNADTQDRLRLDHM